jgi:hypothetical protein
MIGLMVTRQCWECIVKQIHLPHKLTSKESEEGTGSLSPLPGHILSDLKTSHYAHPLKFP